MVTSMSRRFDPIDPDDMRLWAELSPAAHLRAMLDARDFVMGAIRGRVRQLYPELASESLGLKVLEEIAHGERAYTRP